jgi:tetratricopeptide repeat protein 4
LNVDKKKKQVKSTMSSSSSSSSSVDEKPIIYGPVRGEDVQLTKEEDDEIESMPLFMSRLPDADDSSAPQNSDGFAALQTLLYENETNESLAENWKNQGNESFRNASKFAHRRVQLLHEAKALYAKALDQKSTLESKNSVYLSNRAAVNLVLRNYGDVVDDCQRAVELDPANLKAYLRGAKAAFALGKLDVAVQFADRGVGASSLAVQQRHAEAKRVADDPAAREAELDNDDDDEPTAAQLLAQAEAQQRLLGAEQKRIVARLGELLVEQQKRDAEKAARQEAEADARRQLDAALARRGLTLGAFKFGSEHADFVSGALNSGVYLDADARVHYPVLFLYDEHDQTDFVRDMCEDDALDDHLAVMFPPPAGQVPWDAERAYVVGNLELYFDVAPENAMHRKYVHVDSALTLRAALAKHHQTLPIAGFPLIYVIAKTSSHRDTFLRGEQ